MRAAVTMRAPAGTVVLTALLFITSVLLVESDQEDHIYPSGYHPEEAYEEDPLDLEDNNTICPSERLLRSREICEVDGTQAQCIRLHCCDTHVLIAGRCIPKTTDPCSLKLCEQACAVQDDRVLCTCHPGFNFSEENYGRKEQPYCIDVDECAESNGGCDQQCINDPGGHHCECAAPSKLGSDGKRCEFRPLKVLEPLPLIRAASRCYASCDKVSWLFQKVNQLTDQLNNAQNMIKKLLENPLLKRETNIDGDRFAEGTFVHRVLDSTAPLEGGQCRCERGPRGPAGPPGMEGPKGDMGPRGPRDRRGPKGSMATMMLLIADVRHDIRNLEARVYKDGDTPERFNMQKAWKLYRKQERMDQESKTEQELEAYTAPPILSTSGPVEISPNGRNGQIEHDSESTTDWTMVKGESDPSTLSITPTDDMEVKLREFRLLANATATEEEEPDTDYDYSFY